MKKLVVMAVLATAAIAASATDIGVRYTSNANTLADSTGITLGQKFGKTGVELAFDRYSTGDKVDRYSLLGTYDVAQVAGATLTVKAGGAYVQPMIGQDGYAAVVGAGVSYPLTKRVNVVADYTYQRGQDRVAGFDGNAVSVGLKFSF